MRRILRASAAVVVLAGFAGAYLLRDPSPVGYWRSAHAHDEYAAAYRTAFERLPKPTDTADVRTDFGVVRAYRFGSASPGRTPIVLMPGTRSGVPMWAENLPRMAVDRPVIALDALGDAGLSVQSRAIADAGDQAAWLDQALGALGVQRAHIVGHSFGGWAAANLAIRHPERVAGLALFEPVMVFAGLRRQAYVDSIPAALPFLPDSWRRAAAARIGGASTADVDRDPVGRMIDAAMAGFTPKLPTPREFTDADRSRLTMPVYVALGGRSAITDTARAAQVARRLPNATVRVWPEGTHSLPMEVADELDSDLDRFLGQ